MFVRD